MAFWLGVILPSGEYLQADDALTRAQQVEALASPYVNNDMIMGMSIGLIADGDSTIVHLGQTKSDGKKPNDDTLYEIGSISKVFTGILLADLVQRGEVRLDQPAVDLLPESVPMPQWPASTSDDSTEVAEQITLLQLSTHRSGLPRLPDNMPSLESDNPYSDYTSELAYEFLKKHSLRRAPGAEAEYSNLAVSLLGHLLCENANLSYDELLQTRIAKPLGLDCTRVKLSPEMRRSLATPHTASLIPTNTWDFADMPGAGGIRSSIADMLRFAEANLNPPQNETGEAMKLAWKQHQPGTETEFAMGLGWHFARDGATR